jgi:tape measure domain-containing protein
MSLEWILSLRDELSGPARQSAAGLREVSAELKNAAAAALTFDEASGRYRDASGRFAAGPGGGGAADGIGKSFLSASSIISATKGYVQDLEGAVVSVAEKAYDIGRAFAESAIQAADFKDNARIAFDSLAGGAAAGEAAWQAAIDFAAKTPFKTDTIINAYKSLLSGGFKPGEEINNALAGIGDLAALKGDESLIGRLAGQLNKVESQGKLSSKSIQAFAMAGVNAGAIYDALATQLGKPRSEIEKLVKAGKVDASEGVKGILDALKKTTGEKNLGDLTEAMSHTWSGLMSTLQSRPLELLMNLNTSGAMTSLKGFLGNLVDALGPKSGSGAALEDSFRALFEAMFGGLKGLGDKGSADIFNGIITKIAGAINTVASILQAVRPYASALIDGLVDGFRAVVPIFSVVGEVLSQAFSAFGQGGSQRQALITALSTLARLTVVVVGGILALGVAIAGLTYAGLAQAMALTSALGDLAGDALAFAGSLVDAIEGSLASFSDLAGEAVDAGSNIVAGIVQGLENGRAWIVGVVQSLGDSIIATVKSVLGIASPSREMMKLGAFTAQGFTAGLQGDAPKAETAMRTMVDPPEPGSALGSAAGKGGGGGDSHSHYHYSPQQTIHQQGSESPEDMLARWKDMQRQAFEAWLDELGGGPAPQGT